MVMVLPWPFAHQNMLTNPIEAIRTAMRFPYEFPMLFEGKIVISSALPRHYLAKYLLITTPPVLLAGAAIGIMVSLRQQFRHPRSLQSQAIFLLQSWLLLPVALFAIKPPNIYDGIRHFLFVLPAMGLFYALGATWVISLARGKLVRKAIIAGLALVTLTPALSLLHLHPYQMTYFNSLVGGLAGAEGNYETDYWLTSFKEAMEWINIQAAKRPDRRLTVFLATPSSALETARHFKANNVEIKSLRHGTQPGETLPPDVDYAILTTRAGQRPFAQSPVVHTVGRDGAIFCIVRARQ